ncbi:MAG TPA: D-2-hydroxyacid dehydrogenase [Dehalococcoidia bacterium]|nr:D-2-hydroxyacid dehydrogenase [Dehalococcoidia bacterium]
MTRVVVTFALEPELVDEIKAVAPSIEVEVLGQEARRLFRGEARYPSELQAVTGLDELTSALREAEVLFSFWGGAISRLEDFRDRAPKLRWVQLTHAGAERVDPKLIAQGITFTTAGGLAATPIAEFVMAYVLMFSKGWPGLFRAQREHRYTRFMPREVLGKTIGIVGMGYIGGEVARLGKAFGCRVLGMRRSFTARGLDPIADEAVPPSDLPYLLSESDFVVIAAPLTPETRGMIGEAELRQMKRTAYLINIARGPLVDERGLIAALREGTIAGAGLDVFEREPLPPESELWDLDNVILSPHISGGTEIYNKRATAIFCDNLRRFLAGQPLMNVVDPERGY